jgi:hypothetical protein
VDLVEELQGAAHVFFQMLRVTANSRDAQKAFPKDYVLWRGVMDDPLTIHFPGQPFNPLAEILHPFCELGVLLEQCQNVGRLPRRQCLTRFTRLSKNFPVLAFNYGYWTIENACHYILDWNRDVSRCTLLPHRVGQVRQAEPGFPAHPRSGETHRRHPAA